MPRRRFTRIPKSLRRKYEWEWAGLFAQVNMVPGDIIATWARVPASKVDSANASGIPYVIPDDYTLVRTRCLVEFSSDNGSAQARYPWIVAAGLIAWDGVNDDTADIGLLPNPYWDQDLDWIWQAIGPQVNVNLAIAGNGGSDKDAYESKAMRKLSAGTGLLWVFTIADPLNDDAIAVNMQIAMNCRMLFKEA